MNAEQSLHCRGNSPNQKGSKRASDVGHLQIGDYKIEEGCGKRREIKLTNLSNEVLPIYDSRKRR